MNRRLLGDYGAVYDPFEEQAPQPGAPAEQPPPVPAQPAPQGAPAHPAEPVNPAPAPAVTPPSTPAFSAPPSSYVGFDPGAHSGETPTVTNPKYAVLEEWQKMAQQPGYNPLDFASNLSNILNQRFGTSQFKASDGQTLLYGDEYVHTAPAGYGTPGYRDVGGPASELFWGSNGPAPGSGGGGGGAGSGGNGQKYSMDDIIKLGQQLAGPQSGGVYGNNNLQQVGQDPLSLLISGKLGELISNNGRVGPNMEALNLENARGAADRARKAESAQVRATLGNRGTLPEGDAAASAPGLYGDAMARVEDQTIGPLFSQAVRDYTIHDNDLASGRLMNALQQGTDRQGMLSQIALQSLAQNTAFNEFLATFGLDRDKALYEIANGQNSALAELLMTFLQATGISRGGFVGN